MGPYRWSDGRVIPIWKVVLGVFGALLLVAASGFLLVHSAQQAVDVPIPTFSAPPPVSPLPTPSAPPPGPDASPVPSLSPPPVVPQVTLPPLPGLTLGPGATGAAVGAYQQRLSDLHYMVGPADAQYGPAMSYAVTAFQKVQGLQRTGVIDAATQAALQTASIPTATFSSPPDHIEVDLAHQVMFFVHDGVVSQTVTVSTGTDKTFYEKGSTAKHKAVTPNGVFSVLWKYNGSWTSPLGVLYKPSFIDDTLGIAIHGYPEVPPQPASHGCIRIPLAFADAIYAHETPDGITVYVFGGPDGPEPPGTPGAPTPTSTATPAASPTPSALPSALPSAIPTQFGAPTS